jgi:hypothetical protein
MESVVPKDIKVILLVNRDHWSYATFLGHGNEQDLGAR